MTIDVRMPFSRKEFHRRGWGRLLVGGAGVAIGGVLLFTQNPAPASMATIALWTGIVAGAMVELMDYLNNRSNCEKYSAKMMGFLLTSLGGTLAATAIYLVASLLLGR